MYNCDFLHLEKKSEDEGIELIYTSAMYFFKER